MRRYMHPLPGYEINYRDVVLKLLKSLYGLKQASCRWYEVLCCALLDIGFNLSNYDPGIFYARVGDDVLILAVHVDDCILTGSSVELIKNCKALLNSHYPLTDLGPIHWVLGIKITQDCDEWTISLLQSSYIESILQCFNLEDAKPHGSPMTPSTTLTKADALSNASEAKVMAKIPYHKAIRSLMYNTVATWPDISFIVSALSQFLKNPSCIHWEATKWVFHYLSGTKTLALTYSSEHHDLIRYMDADGTS